MHWLRSRRARPIVGLLLIFALIVTFPLSVAFGLAGLDRMGVSARSLRGPVWWGGAEDLRIGDIQIGTVDVLLDPFKLLIGAVRLDVVRQHGRGDDIRGGLTIGMGSRSLDDITGAIPLAAALAPLPISRIEFEDVSVRFSSGQCTNAEGRVRMRVPAILPGINLANGLVGEARCDGQALLMPLASQSGQERIEARFFSDGRYEATMRIRATDPALSGALLSNGFRSTGNGEQMLRVTGRL